MSLRYGNRHQVTLFPSRVEDYIEPDNPVRVYDAFVDALDFEDLGISVDTNKRGCPQYDPHAMLKLFVYGTSYGIHSSRKLERACHDNVSFIWLMGSLKPDYKTISEFRRKNKASIRKVLRKSVDICVDLELIVGNVIFLDGSKIRANAGISKFWTREKLEEERENINRRIDELLEASEAADLEEEGLPSMSKINMKISSAEKMRKSIEKSLKQIEETERKREEKPSHKARKDQKEASANVIDPECIIGKSRQGIHASYNAQVATDEKNGLIVSAEPVSEANDTAQFSEQINNANKNTGKTCDAAVADAGYFNTDKLEDIESQDIKVIVPSARQSSDKEVGKFDKQNFTYDKEKNVYICPCDHELKQEGSSDKEFIFYSRGKKCLSCNCYSECTTNKKGRRIKRLSNEESTVHFEEEYSKKENQELYRKRKAKVELQFGHFKRNLNAGHFLMRGLKGVAAELSLFSTCFNIRRAITIMGTERLLHKLKSMTV